MDRHEQLYRLYASFDTERLRHYQRFVDLSPPIDSPVLLAYWQEARDSMTELRDAIAAGFDARGETLAAIAAAASRDEAFTALDLYRKYDRAVNVLVLDVDDTLRTAGTTDNEIPRETLYLLTRLHEVGLPIVICTGQTLENVKGFLVQGLGNDVALSDGVSIVYEAGTGVFSPGRGPDTKRLLYAELDEPVPTVFDRLRTAVFHDAPDPIREGCHLQGNEFNVTLKPNHEVGTEAADTVIRQGLIHLLDLLEASIEAALEAPTAPSGWARRYYGDDDPEIRRALETADAWPEPVEVPDRLRGVADRIDVGYYAADAAEVRSLELNKVVGVKSALDVLGVADPFAAVLGDSKSDLRVMEWTESTTSGIAAAPEHSSAVVLEHVRRTDGLVFEPGDAAAMLRIVLAMVHLDALETAAD